MYIPDPYFKAALIAAGVDTNNDGEIQESEAEVVIGLDVSAKNILSLEGIQSFINLKNLRCTDNNLISLEMNQNPNLEALECDRNQLTNLDLSQNPLKIISTTDSLLTSLNVKNGDIYSIQSLRTLGNPNLTCIEVDDIDYANNKNCHQGWGWCIDDWTEFSEDCNLATQDILVIIIIINTFKFT